MCICVLGPGDDDDNDDDDDDDNDDNVDDDDNDKDDQNLLITHRCASAYWDPATRRPPSNKISTMPPKKTTSKLT